MDVLTQPCSVCDSPTVDTEDMPCGLLISSNLYSKEAHNVLLCRACLRDAKVIYCREPSAPPSYGAER